MGERSQKSPTTESAERRRRLALRALIDEMLDEIRAAAGEENWTPEARARAEADLARIMEKVRREALGQRASGGEGGPGRGAGGGDDEDEA